MGLVRAFACLVVVCVGGCEGGSADGPGSSAAAVGNPCSLDAGQGWCWQHLYATQDISYWGVWFLDRARGFVTAQDGVLRVTADGGRQWQDQRLPDSPTFGGGMHFTPDGVGFVVAYDRLYRSVDGGSSWQRLDLPGVSGGVRSAQFLDAAHGWLIAWTCGADGDIAFCTATLYATEDAGVSWQARGSHDSSAVFAFADLQTGIKSVYDGLFRSDDGGRTWSRVAPAGQMARSIYFRTSTQGWSVGSGYGGIGNMVMRTEDAGLTWSQAPVPPLGAFTQLYDIRFADDRNGWIAGSNGTVLRTSDGGASWRRQTTGTTLPLFAVFPLDAKRVWTVGARGTILATSTGGEKLQ